MDTRLETPAQDSIVLTGAGHVVLGNSRDRIDEEIVPYLRSPRNKKFMSLQDKLALVASGKALDLAGLAGCRLGERAGLCLAVGYIPFEQTDIDAILAASRVGDRFSITRFSTEGYRAVNPLLTFRCLPNMPAFHVSVNFDIQGGYFVTYPGPGQFYSALDESRFRLLRGEIDLAVVGGVAHQRNYLVAHHFSRVEPPTPPERLLDAAGALVLEREDRARERKAGILGVMEHHRIDYRPHDPFEHAFELAEEIESDRDGVRPCPTMGAATLPVALSMGVAEKRKRLRHRVESRDGFRAESSWRLG